MRTVTLAKLGRFIVAPLLLTGALVAIAPVAAAQAARAAVGQPSAVTPALTYGAAASTQLSQLPVLDPTAEAGGQSSFDRDTFDASHGNRDFGRFLGSGPRGNVMLSQQGPGCVYRIWLTSLQTVFPSEWIKIYFDGASKPSIDLTISQIFAGTNAPFLSPLVQDQSGSSGGYVSYVPICYHQSIEITTNTNRYYNIGYVSYAPNADVKTWRPGTSLAAMQDQWNQVTQDPAPASDQTVPAQPTPLTLKPRDVAGLAKITGPATIQSIRISIPGVTATSGAAAAEVLDNTWIRIYWDGQQTPSVYAPLGSFFAMGQLGSFPTHALVAGMDATDTMYMYLPMPFERAARIQLVNTSTTSVPGITYQIQYQHFSGDFSNVGYFKTSYTTSNLVGIGKDIPILRVTGAGKFVGVTASYTGDVGRSYLEGDERIYVDGSGSPAIYGTGTEDFFNGGFYFQNGPYSQPMSGNTAHLTTASEDQTAGYRFFVQDAIPFRNQIVVSIQHGPHDNTANTSAAMLAYYYQRPAAQSSLTDTLNVGNLASERAHHYTISGQRWSGTSTFQYEGTADTVNVTDNGRGFHGFSQFTMAVAPGNQGVDLRRRFDYAIVGQKAEVLVNGRLVGIWYVAGSNVYHSWGDTDFIIPAAYTRNQHSITIKIVYEAGSRYFTEYKYWAYSLLP